MGTSRWAIDRMERAVGLLAEGRGLSAPGQPWASPLSAESVSLTMGLTHAEDKALRSSELRGSWWMGLDPATAVELLASEPRALAFLLAHPNGHVRQTMLPIAVDARMHRTVARRTLDPVPAISAAAREHIAQVFAAAGDSLTTPVLYTQNEILGRVASITRCPELVLAAMNLPRGRGVVQVSPTRRRRQQLAERIAIIERLEPPSDLAADAKRSRLDQLRGLRADA